MKIVINKCYGGFGLSDKAIEHYAKIKGIELDRRDSQWGFGREYDYFYPNTQDTFQDRYIERNDPALVKTVEELGRLSDGFCALLEVIEIPEDVDWEIAEYDGNEWVAEKHRTWG